MKTLVRIIAQYMENYSDSNVPFWKNKGGQEFELEVNSDLFMYDEENCLKVIKALLEEKSNPHCKYEYRGHELIFSNPVKLDSNKFTAMLALCHISQDAPLLDIPDPEKEERFLKYMN